MKLLALNSLLVVRVERGVRWLSWGPLPKNPWLWNWNYSDDYLKVKLAYGSIVRVVLSPGKVELEFFFALKRTTGKTRKMKRKDNSDVEALFYEVLRV